MVIKTRARRESAAVLIRVISAKLTTIGMKEVER